MSGAAAVVLPVPTSRRLEFRSIAPEDMHGIVALHRDPRITALLVDGIPDTMAKAYAFLTWNEPHAERGYGTYAVRRRGDPALIGLFSLTPFKDDERLLELGGKLAPGAWAGGLAVEAGAALIDHAFGTLGRERLVSAYHPGNRSVPAALGRLGFVATGPTTLFERTVSVMALDAATWRALRR